ncbi:MAG: carbohydrate kinase family protein [Actinobacteria bacterium]|nr:carbohydrate kinase family protein [Actinomycetota bacterium]
MTSELEVLVPGRPSCDLVFSHVHAWPRIGHEVYADDLAIAAGGHFNTAAALRRLNVAVALVAVVGPDLAGEIVLRDVRAERLPEQFVEVVPAISTPVSVALNHDGDRGFVTYAPRWELAEEPVVARTLELLATRPVRHVHGDLSSVSRRVLAAAREAGATFSVDVHQAGPWLASADVRELVAGVDVLFANEDEAIAMTGAADATSALRELGRFVPHVVVKRGGNGALAVRDREAHEVAGADVEVVDATGAGDCFVAGYLWALLRGRAVSECLAVANRCGAAAVRTPGGFRAAPTERELAAASA